MTSSPENLGATVGSRSFAPTTLPYPVYFDANSNQPEAKSVVERLPAKYREKETSTLKVTLSASTNDLGTLSGLLARVLRR